MPLKEHPVFRKPPPNQLLWRYMNFPKFASLITSKTLWFGNMHNLSVDDPYEGLLPKGNFAHRAWTTQQDTPIEIVEHIKRGNFIGKTGDIERDIDAYKKLLDRQVDEIYNARKENFVNCWHMSDFESASMWDIYADRNYGVSITSNLVSVEESLKGVSEEVFIGCVEYIDYSSSTLSMENGFIPALHKRLSFNHEREVRLLIWDFSASEMDVLFPINGTLRVMKGEKPKAERDGIVPLPGKAIVCDLSKLISEIYISPQAPIWFEEAVRSICGLANIDKRVTKSDLLTGPIR